MSTRKKHKHFVNFAQMEVRQILKRRLSCSYFELPYKSETMCGFFFWSEETYHCNNNQNSGEQLTLSPRREVIGKDS